MQGASFGVWECVLQPSVFIFKNDAKQRIFCNHFDFKSKMMQNSSNLATI